MYGSKDKQFEEVNFEKMEKEGGNVEEEGDEENSQNEELEIEQESSPMTYDSSKEWNEIVSLDADGLYEMAKVKQKRVLKIVECDVPFATTSIIQDISIGVKGPMEDDVFAKDFNLHKNIRRGLTLLTIVNIKSPDEQIQIEEEKSTDQKKKKNDIQTRYILRKGLQQFFDLQVQYLNIQGKEFKPNAHTLSSQIEQRLKKITYDPIVESFESGRKVTMKIYNLNQANGENAQVSYIEPLGGWSISSKNVTLVARKVEDLNAYDQSRFGFAKLIGTEWFRLIENLSEKEIAELKQILANHTFVAEYCGNQAYQHLVKYDKIDLHFYAVVGKDSFDTCIPPEAAYSIFKQFGLTFVQMKFQEADSLQKTDDILFNIFQEISESPLEKDGEGAVVYFVEHDVEQNVDRTLSLAQLKTLEYRIFRKLREKLKNGLMKGNFEKLYAKFIKETEELCLNFKPAQKLDYYFQIAKAAFDYIECSMTQEEKNIISDRYITFLDLIIQNVNNNTSLTKAQILEELRKMPLSKEELQELGNIEQGAENPLLEKNHIVFVAPPYYLIPQIIEPVLKNFGTDQIEEDFKDKVDHGSLISFSTLIQPSRLKNIKNNKDQKFFMFIFLGWTDKVIFNILEKVEQKKVTPQSKLEIEFSKNKDQEKMLESSKEAVESLIDVLEEQSIVYSKFEDIYQLGNAEKIADLLKVEILQNLKQKKEIGISKKEKAQQQQESLKQQKIIVYVPMTVPATGKSTFLKFLKQNFKEEETKERLVISSISSDEIRYECMNEVRNLGKNQSASDEDLFNQTTQMAGAKFTSKLEALIQSCVDSEHERHIVFIDKNHPESALQGTIETIRSVVRDSEILKIIALIPKIEAPLKARNNSYPFSMAYFITCIHRAITRETHETLTGDDAQLTGVVALFFGFFRNQNFTDHYLKTHGFDASITLPFHNEQNQNNISQELYEAAIEFISASNPKNPSDNPKFVPFITALYSEPAFQEIPLQKQVQLKHFMEQLEISLQLFNKDKDENEKEN